MIKKEKRKNGSMHYVYICDYCESKFTKNIGGMVYKLKRKGLKGEKHFCSYKCRCDYLRESNKKEY